MTRKQRRIFTTIDRLRAAGKHDEADNLAKAYLNACKTEVEADELLRWGLLRMIKRCTQLIKLAEHMAQLHPDWEPKDIEDLFVNRAQARRALAELEA
jgi:hypothetical protein